MDLYTIAAILSLPCAVNTEITGICTDSRLIQPGNIFIALEGERFNGQAFLQEAVAKGAKAAVVKEFCKDIFIPQLVVASPLVALGHLATAHRQAIHCPIIALTGSNGKTTVKEMIAAILPRPSHATKGNLNNHIGVPLSLLALQPEHRYAVFELGANHLGEIAHSVAMVKPCVALINNIAPAHVEGFGSIKGVAQAKGEIYQGLSPEGIAVVNNDDAYAHFWDEILRDKATIRFSLTHPTDIYAQGACLDPQGRGQFSLVVPHSQATIHLQVLGLHNIGNALAAAACCYAIGIPLNDIAQGLNAFTGVQGRMNVLVGRNEATIIDDTYNANLRSVLAGLEVLAKRPGDKIFVFGDMGELGEWAIQHHKEVGLEARRLGVNSMLTWGSYSELSSHSFGEGGQHFTSHDDIVDYLLNKLNYNTTVLVKGSRSSAMEKIVYKLLN